MFYEANSYFDFSALEYDFEIQDIIRYKTILNGLFLPISGISRGEGIMGLSLETLEQIDYSTKIEANITKEDRIMTISIFRNNPKTNENVHYYIKSYIDGYDITIHLSNQENNLGGIYYIKKKETLESQIEEYISYYDLEACNRVVPNYSECLTKSSSDLYLLNSLNNLDNSDSLFNKNGIYPDIYFGKDIEGYSNDASLEMAKELNQFIKNSDIESTYKYCKNLLDNKERRTSNFVLSLD